MMLQYLQVAEIMHAVRSVQEWSMKTKRCVALVLLALS
ncbi:Uncharacterised protein [Mycobacteroides abscessus]|nr:Uncharacterised protein [Mycobacteroides abscessus]